jgi:diaminopimelate decarboxylase
MTQKTIPFSPQQIAAIIEKHPTPFHLYDERQMRENARALSRAFSWNAGFREYFAVKATPNPFLLKILGAEGCGADCSSLPELLLAEKAGLHGEDIMFTSNDTPAEEFQEARRQGGIINLDDISHIEFLQRCAGLPELICCRYNPGPLKQGNTIIGRPEEAKYGFTREQLFEGYRLLRDKGIKHFGIHTMVASNELDPRYFVETAQILFELVAEISRKLGIRFEFANIGGGVGIPYRPEQEAVDLRIIGEGVKASYDAIIGAGGWGPLKVFMECGRYITGPCGYLITRVRHLKKTYRNFAGLDACMANLMRPAIYGAYHHITVLGKQARPADTLYDVTGSLCENNDKFAVNRKLPELEIGDTLVIHDAGAHGHAMGFNYNGKLRSAELLLREGGSVELIRRAESIDDHFATLDWGKMADFKV